MSPERKRFSFSSRWCILTGAWCKYKEKSDGFTIEGMFSRWELLDQVAREDAVVALLESNGKGLHRLDEPVHLVPQ